jgi:hypothetical protein
MPRLHELQSAFAAAIVEGKSLPTITSIQAGSSWRSLALYRRLIRNNYVQALTITYPVLHRLVGDRYFKVFARGYLKRFPSTSGDLFAYGRHLPLFLFQLGSPRLLIELARLEWACHEVYQASDSPPLVPDQLSAVASADPSRVTFHLNTAVRLLRLSMPVHHLWHALQSDDPTTMVADRPLPDEETDVVVTRARGNIHVTALAALDFRLLDAMADRKSVAEVEQIAMEYDSEFDFSRFLASILELNLLRGVSTEGRT